MKHPMRHPWWIATLLLLTQKTPGRPMAWLDVADVQASSLWVARLQTEEGRQREADREAQKVAREEEAYQRGTQALDEKRWERALEAFDQVAAQSGRRADGALYWKAYSLSKLGRRAEALAGLSELFKKYPESRWIGDAKALEVETRQAAGRPVAPEAESNEELKLIALNSLMNVEPARAVPLLEKFLSGNQSPKLKERALFVLAQSDAPRALEILAQTARGQANPDLQRKAVEYLGLFGSARSLDLLGEIYAGATDPTIKRAVLHSFMLSDATDRLLAMAQQEKDPKLRKEAIHQLGLTDGQDQLWQLYQHESELEVKEAILHALFLADNVDKLVEVAQKDKLARLRKAAIHSLGLQGSKPAAAALAALYGSESELEIRRQILHAMFLQDNAKALVEIARKERDPELKREAIHKLSLMDDPEASDFLLELLEQ